MRNPLARKMARPLLVAGEKAWRFAVLLARHDQAIDGCMEFWIVELPGDADEVRQIVVTQPDPSTPSTAAIASTFSMPVAVSTSAITIVRAFAWAILSASGPPE
jgi:hypothetical protein